MWYKYQTRNNLYIKRKDTCFLNNGKDELVSNSSIHVRKCCQLSHATAVTQASDKESDNTSLLIIASLSKEYKHILYNS